MGKTILHNARIYTMDAQNSGASAIAIENERIVAVGGQEVLSLKTPSTRMHDMQGAVLLPGFCDAHIHWSWTALNMKAVNLFDIPSKQHAVEMIAEATRAAKPGEWIYGFGWAQGMWEGGHFPTAADLDAVTPENPVYLPARSGHATWVNSLALKIAGITDATPNPEQGEIQRDKNGRATGILFEDANVLVGKHVPKKTQQEIADAVREAQPEAWKTGLTQMHDYDGPDAFAAYQILKERGELGIRIMKNVNDEYIHHAHNLGLRSYFGDEWLRIGGLKIFADGALGSVTALMIDPYEGEAEYRGLRVTSKERMRELVLEGTRLGFFATIHAIGDLAVRDVLDVFEEARKLERELGIPRLERRHRIEHFQLVHPDDVHRLGDLDITASIQSIHATADIDMADRHWGKRARLGYNPRVGLDRGTCVVLGSDAPVEPFNPIRGIHAAVTRRRPDGSPGPDGWWPEARTTVEEALRCYTSNCAWSARLEDKLGMLKPGYLADIVALDKDPYQVEPHDLLSLGVQGTMVGGNWVWGHWLDS